MKLIQFTFFLFFLYSSSIYCLPILSSYPASDKVWISTEVFNISYLDQEYFSHPADLKVTLLIEDGAWVSKDDPLFIVNQKNLELERRTNNLERSQLNLILDQIEKDHKKFKQDITTEIAQSNDELAKIKLLSENPDLPPNLKQKSISIIEEIQTSILSLKKEISPERLTIKLENQKEDVNLRFLKSQQSFRDLEERSTRRASFEGRIDYLLPNLLIDTEIKVKSNEEFISLTNDQEVQITCLPSSEYFKIARPQSTTIKLDFLDKALEASFHNRILLTEGTTRTKQLAYRPKKNQHINLISHINTSRMGQVYYHFDTICYLVPKKDIIALYPDILENDGWMGLAKKVWPDEKLVYISPKHLAIEKR